MKIKYQLKIIIITILFMSNYLYSQKSFEIYSNLIFIEKLPMPYEIVTLKINNIYSKKNLSKLEFLILLSKAKRIQPKDEKLRSWHYSSWCNIQFLTIFGSYELKLYLGGLGFLTLPDGKTGALLFDLNGK
ncbi:hypothetical protein ACO2J1_06715 [Leptospira interrogans]|uniref:Uncharacterized protein n=6 Tax=Leptospira interrogans TaxID=173 RepID=A0AA40WAH9_LEPIR|nr:MULTISPECIES: hypothetical protein [Leptospira]ASV06329.1 hypothetical protein B2G47_10575 [Leptospira interrogans serovar Canicola]EJO77167.1 hypothetical protein LEP1GSC045_0979 [Leptospira interrogans serovar Pomona str. Kennewicki LC82-25]EKN96723.1 hypothetical protein LEP1GSC014_3752 [Leptospira interrogans serovar Pomona str. Pomona]EKO68923.1 hypothetical protein LEP1GSC069_4000 [Leptospira interrogans serovar Canicola str. Fiocruz LV133]EKR36384.1 hypothetical protein LEP1GSC096_44